MNVTSSENITTNHPLVLNEEQQLLKNAAKDFLKNNAPISQLRHLRDSKDTLGYSPEVWNAMVQNGWNALIIPEKYTGLEFGFVGLGVILEEMGKTLTASPLFATALLSASTLILVGNEKQKNELLPQIADGKLLMSVAIDESNHHNPLKINTQATLNENEFLLNGTKKFVIDGHIADKLIVAARTSTAEKDISLFLIDTNKQGISIQKNEMIDNRNSANIHFENVQVSENELLGNLNQGLPILEKVLDLANIGLAAEMLGMMQEAFERTIAYLKQRQQFGVPIGSFQGLQHRAADMFCEIELCKSAVLKALIAVEENDLDLSKYASLAKAKACDVLKRVSNEAIQMFGGIGMTDDEEIGFFLKRARVAQQTFGDYNYHLNRLAVLQGY